MRTRVTNPPAPPPTRPTVTRPPPQRITARTRFVTKPPLPVANPVTVRPPVLIPVRRVAPTTTRRPPPPPPPTPAPQPQRTSSNDPLARCRQVRSDPSVAAEVLLRERLVFPVEGRFTKASFVNQNKNFTRSTSSFTMLSFFYKKFRIRLKDSEYSKILDYITNLFIY